MNLDRLIVLALVGLVVSLGSIFLVINAQLNQEHARLAAHPCIRKHIDPTTAFEVCEERAP